MRVHAAVARCPASTRPPAHDPLRATVHYQEAAYLRLITGFPVSAGRLVFPSLSYLYFCSFGPHTEIGAPSRLSPTAVHNRRPLLKAHRPRSCHKLTGVYTRQVEVVMGAGPQMPYPKWVWTPAGGW